ncbi:unnamed protein product [Brassicogethes aeneus]|uniref:Division abnormally delayed protein n=1 Tax=Brassicogethes aeneus TaxID=1431903 RepID=A0A9P0FJV8_BRAAE|nr:unnamed protein product [Brassicogethes aeneus]
MKQAGFFVATLAVLVVFCEVSCKNVNVNINSRPRRSSNGLSQSCGNVEEFFQIRNITVKKHENAKGSICGGECCDDRTESLLARRGQQDFADMLRHNSRSLQGLLSSTSDIVQNHVLELASQSENKTQVLFSQVYQGMAVLSKEPISNLYRDISTYVVGNTTEGELNGASMDIKNSVHDFFTELFPLAYHGSANTPKRDFTVSYKICLKKSMESILPFGDIPKQISMTLSKSLEATRLLLQAFNIGKSVLNSTDSLLTMENSSPACHKALMKMTYCPKCQGLPTSARPCSGYCLNVIRGCITRYVSELDLPWNDYVESIESLVNAIKKNNNDAGVNVDLVIRNLDNQISSAIMHSMERTKEIDAKVKIHCGPAEFSKKEDPLLAEVSTPAPAPTNGKPSRLLTSKTFSPLPEQQLSQFLASISKTRGFYGNFADSICHDGSFAEPKDKNCWNGERISDYTKMVVEWNMQKYNPEVKPGTDSHPVDPKLPELVDKLRHVHNLAVSSLGPFVEDYMQQDGIDGSGQGQGSGREPDFDDDEDGYSNNGSGSGVHPVPEDYTPIQENEKLDIVPRVIQSGAFAVASSNFVLPPLVFCLIAFIY